MAKYSKHDPNNKKRSKDKRAKNAGDSKIRSVESRRRINSTELTRMFAR